MRKTKKKRPMTAKEFVAAHVEREELPLPRLMAESLAKKVFVANKPINISYSFDSLKRIVQEVYGRDAEDGTFFVFFNGNCTKCKVLLHRLDGWWIFYKRMHKGTFRLPQNKSKVFQINATKMLEVIETIRL